jgi:hypothetical protein
VNLALTILVALAPAGAAVAAPNRTTLNIRHQTHDCHDPMAHEGNVLKLVVKVA